MYRNDKPQVISKDSPDESPLVRPPNGTHVSTLPFEWIETYVVQEMVIMNAVDEFLIREGVDLSILSSADRYLLVYGDENHDDLIAFSHFLMEGRSQEVRENSKAEIAIRVAARKDGTYAG